MKILRLGQASPTPVFNAARQLGHTFINKAHSTPDAVIVSGAAKKDINHAKKALAAGIPVFCATPRATGKALDGLIELGQQHNTLVYVPYHRRVFAPYAALVNQVTQDTMGEVGFIKIHSNQAIPRGYTPGKGAPCAEVIAGSMVHDIDWLNLNFGPIRTVFCQGTQQVKPKTEYAMSTFTLKKGVIAQVIHSYQTRVLPSLRVEICAKAGMVQFDSTDLPIRQTPPRTVKEQAASDAAATWSGHWAAFAHRVEMGQYTAKDARNDSAPAHIAALTAQSAKTSQSLPCR